MSKTDAKKTSSFMKRRECVPNAPFFFIFWRRFYAGEPI
nr:MAG TPA: hypothetical protein [Caudoviricetes sp.]